MTKSELIDRLARYGRHADEIKIMPLVTGG